MWKFITVFLLSLALTTEGWFSNKERDPDEIRQHPEEDVNNECLQYSRSGDCRFYNCLEKRFPCGRNGFAYLIGSYYCPRAKTSINNFNGAGRVWLNATMMCHMSRMRSIYEAESTSCNNITTTVFNIQQECYVENGFCKIFWENRKAIWKIFQTSDGSPSSPHSMQILKNIVKISSECISEKAHEFTRWIESHKGFVHYVKEAVKNKASSAWEKIKNWFG